MGSDILDQDLGCPLLHLELQSSEVALVGRLSNAHRQVFYEGGELFLDGGTLNSSKCESDITCELESKL
jgi:hypothetical protein